MSVIHWFPGFLNLFQYFFDVRGVFPLTIHYGARFVNVVTAYYLVQLAPMRIVVIVNVHSGLLIAIFGFGIGVVADVVEGVFDGLVDISGSYVIVVVVIWFKVVVVITSVCVLRVFSRM